MTFKPLTFFAIGVAAVLIGCGGGGGGGNGSTGATATTGNAAPFTAIIVPSNASFPGARVSAGSSGIAYGFFYAGGNLNTPHALYWNPASGSMADFNPGSYLRSMIEGTDGVQQVGEGARADDPNEIPRGIVWNGSQANAVEILPAGWDTASLLGVDNGFQVGSVGIFTPPTTHAALFNNTSASFVDLAPAGYFASFATCISGNMIGGYALPVGPDDLHAAVWTNHTAASFVDLHPAAYKTSQVAGVDGTHQVGNGLLFTLDVHGAAISHALLWTGTAASVVDLNPAGQLKSVAAAVRNGVEVGQYVTDADSVQKACYWTGTAASMVDLDHYITVTHTGSSATWIDSQGNIYGNVLLANNGVEGVVWRKNP